ncbi:MAG: hypothetical protein RBT63_04650 [Bdellovibrionales bacterium]|nr:hypothetical protein [Bdellovibrionales bacterium]
MNSTRHQKYCSTSISARLTEDHLRLQDVVHDALFSTANPSTLCYELISRQDLAHSRKTGLLL